MLQTSQAAPRNDGAIQPSNQTERIRELNDAFRADGLAIAWATGRVLFTTGVVELGIPEQMVIMRKVKNFNEFTRANDPHGEHDFGAFIHNGTHIFWKIDYYDLSLKYGSPDPANGSLTCRVLTVMTAQEY